MGKYSSRDLAFFSIMETAVNLNLVEEKSNFSIELSDLERKIDITRDVILENINSLEGAGLLKIKNVTGDTIVLDVTNYKSKLSEFFSHEEIDRILMDFDKFIKKFDHLLINSKGLLKYTEIIKKRLAKGEGDINDIIKNGIEEIFDVATVLILEKKIYNLCEYVNEEELQIIEVILFTIYNFEKSENPFFVTLFLASVYEKVNMA